jgi:hypothetical protein
LKETSLISITILSFLLTSKLRRAFKPVARGEQKKKESFEQKNSSTSMHVPMHRCYNKNDFKIFYYSLIFYSYPFNNLNHLRWYYAAPLVYIKK